MDLETNLGRLGYNVIGSATSGEEALDSLGNKAANDNPNLILMDIQLSGDMDGLTTAAMIQQRFDIPIVFLTANVNEDTIVRAKESGSYGFLNKPFRVKELNATIEIALHQHRAGKAIFAEKGWLRTTLGSISDGVIATDASGVIRFLNSAAAELTGWSSVDALGKPIEQGYSLTHLDGQAVEHCQIRRALQEVRSVPKERFLLDLREGGTRAIEGAASPIVENGQLVGAVTIFLDISVQLQRERDSQDERNRLNEQVQLTSEALGQTREELQALSRYLMKVQEEERRRVARELHDDLGQQAALVSMQLDRFEAERPSTSAELATIRAGLNTLAQGLREVSHRLHPSVLEDLGLTAALDALVTDFRRQGLALTDSIAHVEKLPADAGTSLFRIAQESLRNVLKHASGSDVRLTLHASRTEVVLRITDNGPGFFLAEAKSRGGLGLVSMQERASLAGGNLSLTAEPDKGTTVLARIPLRP